MLPNAAPHRDERTAALAACATLAVAALFPLPYGFYGVLRWLCVGAFTFLGVRAYRRREEPRAWILFTMAGLYNPIVPVHLTREAWRVVNILTLVAVAWLTLRSRRG